MAETESVTERKREIEMKLTRGLRLNYNTIAHDVYGTVDMAKVLHKIKAFEENCPLQKLGVFLVDAVYMPLPNLNFAA